MGVWVVGVGPGDPEYVPVKTRRLIHEADVVAGFGAALAVVKPWLSAQIITIDYRNQEDTLKQVGELAASGRRCVICCYGDPNFSDKEFLSRIRSVCGPVSVIPGISSVQVACATLGVAMEEALFLTFHKRGDIDGDKAELLNWALNGSRSVLLLPRPWDFMPAQIARYLVDGGVPGSAHVAVLEGLTLDMERVRNFTLDDLSAIAEQFSDLSIMVLLKPGE
ncbi:MAG: cobalt-precorrin-6Y C(5)-methyltransferase [Dehalococcoidia bacterium]|nr:cobalt-precorrin-6Y C(5)-methyltransferase [Dehalococcoidia bacterium]